MPRLKTSDTPLSSIPEENNTSHSSSVDTVFPNGAPHTPVRHRMDSSRNSRGTNISRKPCNQGNSEGHSCTTVGVRQFSQGTDDGGDSVERTYSPPSPYSLSPSPSSPHSPTESGRGSKRRKLDGVGQFSPRESPSSKYGGRDPDSRRGHQSGSGLFKTPIRDEGQRKRTTPDSASRYKRSLDLSQLEARDTSPPSRGSIMDQFEATYRSLKSKPIDPAEGEDLDGLFDEPNSPHPSDYDLPSQDSKPHEYSSATPTRRQQHSHVLTRAPPGPHITVTGSDGSRVYLRIKSEAKYGRREEVSLVRENLMCPWVERV